MDNNINVDKEVENNLNDDFILKNVNEKREFVTEGKATVKLSNQDQTFSAFYNPAQVFFTKIIYI